MKAPATYSQWLECFDMVKEGTNDSEVLKCMKEGQLTLSAGVAERFASNLSNLIQFRLKRATDRFSRSMQTARGDLNTVTNALLAIRKEFRFLMELSKLPVIPEHDSKLLASTLKQQADSMQNSLESTSLKNDRTGTLTSIIRRNKVNNLEAI